MSFEFGHFRFGTKIRLVELEYILGFEFGQLMEIENCISGEMWDLSWYQIDSLKRCRTDWYGNTNVFWQNLQIPFEDIEKRNFSSFEIQETGLNCLVEHIVLQ